MHAINQDGAGYQHSDAASVTSSSAQAHTEVVQQEHVATQQVETSAGA